MKKTGRIMRKKISGSNVKKRAARKTLSGFRQVEKALDKSEKKFRLIFEYAPLGILHFDSNGIITECNDNFVKIIGSSRKALVGLNMLGLPDRQVVSALREALEGRVSSYEGDYKSTTAQKVTPVRVVFGPVFSREGAAEGGIGIIEDITLRKLTEETLRENEERFRTLTETTATAIFVYANDRFVYVNNACQQLTGYSADELLSRRFWDVVHPEYKELIKERGFARQRGENIPSRYEFKIVRKDGTERWIDFTSGKIQWQGKAAAIASAFDITERKQAEEEKQRLESQLLHAQKMEAVGRLAGGVAHDFNNMLNVIIGYAEIVLGKIGQDAFPRNEVEEIIKAATRSASLTQQLLAFSRKQIIQPRVLDINALLKNLEKMLRRLIGEHIDVVFALEQNVGRVKADPVQIEQVIMNLAINARDAMIKGGKMTIETAMANLNDLYSKNHAEVAPGRYSMIAITDTGQGMDDETKSKIFEPFFTTKDKGKGTGLGLAMVYGIIKQSGGHIFVYSEPGHGTTFKIYLPCTDAAPDVTADVQRVKEHRGGNEHILVVEDEAKLRRLFEATIPSMGYRVTTAANGSEALVLVEERGLKPDLVVTDVVMPGMGGVELVERLRKNQPALRVLFMSGYTDNAIVHQGILDPGTPFIQKPFHIKDLAVKIKEVMQGTD
ncbi:MAG: PAS domain S-box protein [Deltaproteobacteria bacterium]|nr:PAS domain S-box protein [Deltaproteobacteria bacterium]